MAQNNGTENPKKLHIKKFLLFETVVKCSETEQLGSAGWNNFERSRVLAYVGVIAVAFTLLHGHPLHFPVAIQFTMFGQLVARNSP